MPYTQRGNDTYTVPTDEVVKGWDALAISHGFSRTFLGRSIRKIAKFQGSQLQEFKTLEEAILKAKTLPTKLSVGITHTPAGIDDNLVDVYTIRSGVVGGKGVNAGTLMNPHLMNHRREEHAWINCNEGEWGHNVIGVDTKLEEAKTISVKIEGKITRVMMIDWEDEHQYTMKFSRATRDFEIFRVDEEITKAMIAICKNEWHRWNYWCMWIDDVEEDAYDLNFYRLNGIMMVSIDEKKKKVVRVKKEETPTPTFEDVVEEEVVDSEGYCCEIGGGGRGKYCDGCLRLGPGGGGGECWACKVGEIKPRKKFPYTEKGSGRKYRMDRDSEGNPTKEYKRKLKIKD